ncbi:MAG: hypothetical protein WCA49_07655 [Candidatus Sulfotelmatobacter sp.]
MKRRIFPPPLPPLSLKVLGEVEDVEEYARLSLHRCGDTRYFNAEKAVRILRTCVVESLDVQIEHYKSLPSYHPEWIRDVTEKTIESVVGLVGISGAEHWDFFQAEVRQTVKEHLAAKARAVRIAPKATGSPAPPSKTVTTNPKEITLSNRERIEKFILKMADSGTKITRKKIWLTAGYRDATEFERFQRGSSGNRAANAAFNRILSMEADAFLELLKKSNR